MNKRPILFTSACILSFIGSGLAFLAFSFASVFYHFISEWVVAITNNLSVNGTSRLYFVILAIAHAFSFLAIVSLWKYRKSGFYLYLIAQISILLLPVVYIGSNSLSVINLVFTILFSAIYFFYYRWIVNQSKPS